jgi:tetratricopeptide (TPR) repeat protein
MSEPSGPLPAPDDRPLPGFGELLADGTPVGWCFLLTADLAVTSTETLHLAGADRTDAVVDVSLLTDGKPSAGRVVSLNWQHSVGLIQLDDAQTSVAADDAGPAPRIGTCLAVLRTDLGAFLVDPRRSREVPAMSYAERRERLAKLHPAATDAKLAVVLSELSEFLSKRGQNAEAATISAEAAEAFKALTAKDPQKFEPMWAVALQRLGVHLARSGRVEESLEFGAETIEVYRRLVSAHPSRFTEQLALAWYNHAIDLADLAYTEDAVMAAAESVELYLELSGVTGKSAATFDAPLAGARHNLAVYLTDVGRREEGLAVMIEAVDGFRRLVAAHPTNEPKLIKPLSVLRRFLRDLGRLDAALPVAVEAVGLCRRLAVAQPGKYADALAEALDGLTEELSSAGRVAEAETASLEAALLRQ